MQLPLSMRLVKDAPQAKLSSFKLSRFLLNQMVEIRTRNIDSIYRNIGSVVFLVDNL